MRRYEPEGPPGARRIFVAVPIAAGAVAPIAAMVDAIRAAGDPKARDVRWVRLDGLHLTIRFLGPTTDDRLADVVAAVDETARTTEPFEVVIAGGGAFPTPARPRTLWLGVEDGAEHLAAAAVRLGEALAGRGWTIEDRPYRPHLTLARSDGVRAGSAVAKRLIAAAADVRETFTADSLALLETISGGGPARYVPLHEVRLGSPA